MLIPSPYRSAQTGVTLIEVLVTIIILACGLLGLAAFQVRVQTAEMESYQRAQALILAADMAERIKANQTNAASYLTSGLTPANLGTGDTTSCNAPTTRAQQDMCAWSSALQGAAETQGTTSVGAMLNAVGCIEQTQTANSASGVCTPAVYRVTVAWQGLNSTVQPNLTCGQGMVSDDTMRRVVSSSVTVALLSCT